MLQGRLTCIDAYATGDVLIAQIGCRRYGVMVYHEKHTIRTLRIFEYLSAQAQTPSDVERVVGGMKNNRWMIFAHSHVLSFHQGLIPVPSNDSWAVVRAEANDDAIRRPCTIRSQTYVGGIESDLCF